MRIHQEEGEGLPSYSSICSPESLSPQAFACFQAGRKLGEWLGRYSWCLAQLWRKEVAGY